MPRRPSRPEVIKPQPLRPGDTVGVVAPASPIQRDLLERGCRALEEHGYKVALADGIFSSDLYFAGSHDQRARAVEEMFARDDVRAILCARGGYGCNYLLERIDIEIVRRNPKIFAGYSDTTTLLTWFCDAAGLVTFHAPMVTKDWGTPGGVHARAWASAVGMSATSFAISDEADTGIRGLIDGSGEGVLYGGCLSMLAASLGTPYEIATEGKILFVEDVATKPFQIDRMLMHLKLAGKLDLVRGIVFGEMVDCVQPGGQDYRLEEVIKRVVADLGVPVAYGLRSGHVTKANVTLPIGVPAALRVNGRKASLTMLESGVESEIPTHKQTTEARRPVTRHR
jgi:muramoyltetrapeptide carboxypeptidase